MLDCFISMSLNSGMLITASEVFEYNFDVGVSGIEITVPVGLFGVVTNTSEGFLARICMRAVGMSIVKSAARGPAFHFV